LVGDVTNHVGLLLLLETVEHRHHIVLSWQWSSRVKGVSTALLFHQGRPVHLVMIVAVWNGRHGHDLLGQLTQRVVRWPGSQALSDRSVVADASTASLLGTGVGGIAPQAASLEPEFVHGFARHGHGDRCAPRPSTT
jgi:hypothetical protein